MMIKYKGEPEIGSQIGKADYLAVCKELRNFSNSSYDHHETIIRFEKAFSNRIGAKYAISVSSCAVGLDMVLKYLSLKQGDEVLSSAINFHGTHLSIINSGAKLILVEANEDLNIDIDDLAKKISAKTKAIVVTHMNGLSCDMNRIKKLVQGTDIKIIEDAARSLGGRYYNCEIGKESWACVYSFQYKKMITTLGEGGMIVTNDEKLFKALQKYRSFGLGDDWGTNYKMTSVQAAIGLSQLKYLDRLISKRRRLAQYRSKQIKNRLSGFVCPTDNDIFFNVYYLYTVLVPKKWNKDQRDELIMLMKEDGIECVVANPPTYKKNKYILSNYCGNRMIVSEKIGNRIICLPIHPKMKKKENKYIIDKFIHNAEIVEKHDNYKEEVE